MTEVYDIEIESEGFLESQTDDISIICKDIIYKYDSRSFMLNIKNLSLNNNSHIAIVGESGCGKSTLLKLLSGLYEVPLKLFI